MSWRERPISYDAETIEGEAMGRDVNDEGMAWDRSEEYPGLLVVRLYTGHGLRGRHHPSPALSRADVARLWRWSRRQDVALPTVSQDWWLACSEGERAGVKAALKLLRPVAWIAFWLTA